MSGVKFMMFYDALNCYFVGMQISLKSFLDKKKISSLTNFRIRPWNLFTIYLLFTFIAIGMYSHNNNILFISIQTRVPFPRRLATRRHLKFLPLFSWRLLKYFMKMFSSKKLFFTNYINGFQIQACDRN